MNSFNAIPLKLSPFQYKLNIDKKKSKYVAVLVKPNENILEEIKNLPLNRA